MCFYAPSFSDFGSPAQVSRALRHLVANGVLVKLGVGVFAKAKASVLTGKPIPVRPLEVLAPLVLQKLGVKITAGRAVREYNASDSLQLPAGIVFLTRGHGVLIASSASVVGTSFMKIITPEQVELIDAVLAEVDVGLLTASILEKKTST
nr:hypothetical protein GCM10020185_43400 [Pseudomonas brassicacearum subsp. brassicacearum]